MNDLSAPKLPTFYMTGPAPCPYLPGRMERKMFTYLSGLAAGELNDALTHAGFRRSQNIAYRPACEDCQACVSVRVAVRDFKPSKSFKRILKANADLKPSRLAPQSRRSQFDLLRKYLDKRHGDGGMANMSGFEYMSMIEETPVDSHVVEYHAGDRLLACVLMDRLSDGFSMVYSFYEPDQKHRSLGTHMILDQIRRTREAGLDYLYLGYWISGCKKMAYKERFHPLEQLTKTGWTPFISPTLQTG